MTSPVCVISIIKIAHTRVGQTIKSNVTFARIFWRKQKLITLTIQISKILFTIRGSGLLWNLFYRYNKIIKDGKEVANKFNKYFANTIKKLNLKKDTGTSFEFPECPQNDKTKFGKKNYLCWRRGCKHN